MSGASTTGDLTGLTGMLATPAKGLKYKGMREDGDKRAEGAEIEEAFHKMENDLKTLRTESANARAKIQDLEEELKVMKTRNVKAVNEAESGKQREKDLVQESEKYKAANRGEFLKAPQHFKADLCASRARKPGGRLETTDSSPRRSSRRTQAAIRQDQATSRGSGEPLDRYGRISSQLAMCARRDRSARRSA